MKKKIFIVGNGGHAKVITYVLRDKFNQITFIERNKNGKNLISENLFFKKYHNKNSIIFNGIGFSTQNQNRQKANLRFKKKGFVFNKIVSKNSFIYGKVNLGNGCQILNNVVLQPDCSIGDHTVINTGSIIEHDVKIGKNCFIAPGTVICGNVTIEDNVYIGPKSCIASNIKIKKNSIIGAGSTVFKNIKTKTFYYNKK